MELKKAGIAGTMESSDIMVTVEKESCDGVQIELESSVEKQFGDAIRKVIRETAEALEVNNVKIKAVDKGALDCTIRARVKTAIYRACENQDYLWGATR